MGGLKRVRRLLAQGMVVGLLLVAAVPIVAFGGDGGGARVDAPGFTDKLFTGPSIVPSLFENAPVKAEAIGPADEIVVGPGILGVLPGFTDGVLTGPSIVPSLIEGVPSGAARVMLPAPRIEAPGVSDGVLIGPSIVPSLFQEAPLTRNYPYQAAWTQVTHHPRREPS